MEQLKEKGKVFAETVVSICDPCVASIGFPALPLFSSRGPNSPTHKQTLVIHQNTMGINIKSEPCDFSLR